MLVGRCADGASHGFACASYRGSEMLAGEFAVLLWGDLRRVRPFR